MHESKERKHLIVKTPCLIYTPRRKDTGERLRLLLNDADWVVANRYRGTFRVRGIVTDQNTGKRYRIQGAACGLQCRCDATAEEV